VRVFHNQVNLGYGGNQKRGYRYAQERGFDVVVLLHGDGQYAPEVMDQLLEPLLRGEADAVLGSRMMHPGSARAGGMPLYKFAGNKILTFLQNRLLGRKLSEYHSGYRAYNVHALRQLPLLANANDFHFDTEIIIQLMEGGYRIREVPIPTYYGDEICRVNGLAYAWNVMKTTLRYRLHKAGLLYARQFDLMCGEKYTFKHNRYSSHQRILNLLGL
jgi:glycosyltransferase involved in cell wall biosynthesis